MQENQSMSFQPQISEYSYSAKASNAEFIIALLFGAVIGIAVLTPFMDFF